MAETPSVTVTGKVDDVRSFLHWRAREYNKLVRDGRDFVAAGGLVAAAVILTGDDGTELELATFGTPATRPAERAPWETAGIRSVTFIVPDLDAALARARAAGYPEAGEIVGFDQTAGRLAVVYLIGPDSVIVTLAQEA